MKVSLNWLNRFVKIDDLKSEDIANKLTFAGVEVDSVSSLAKGTNLVIGKILSCEKHPDSDHLHVLKVDEGSKYGVHQIVCGAPNARTGLKVIVAREGAVLPLVTIEKSEIRGVESDGMCCALYELGVDKKYLSEKQCAGIEELPEDAEIGREDVLHYLGLDDTILELELLANRSDLNAMENVAKEVGTLFERDVKEEKVPTFSEVSSSFKVNSLTPNCQSFDARVIKGIKVGPSPKWLADILRSEGVRSISNVVDAGNFIMLLTGEPLNMYDYDALPEPKLEVNDTYCGPFVAEDGKSYQLQKGDLVVSSGSKSMCLAGIMTSKEAAVTSKTVNVVIEAANFVGAPIRHTSSRLGLASESSGRFVKGINPDQLSRVLSLAAGLLQEIAGAKTIEKEVCYDVFPHKEKKIATSLSYINARLGTSFTYEEVKKSLLLDHMKLEEVGNGKFIVSVPSYRIDMTGEADVSEEVIRLLGYDKVPTCLPNGGGQYQGLTEAQQKRLSIRRFLRNQGLDEVITYTLINSSLVNSFNYLTKGEAYKLTNPMTEDHQYVRLSLLPSLLQTASYNVAHQIKNLAIFEVSDIDSTLTKGLHLGVVMLGEESNQDNLRKRPYDFYSAKGLLEGIMDLLLINPSRYQIVPLSKNDKEEFHPGRSAEVRIGHNLVGVLGELHPVALKKLDLGKNGVAMELDLSALLETRVSSLKAIVPPKFPTVSRDLAFLIDKKVNYEAVKKEIKMCDKLITDVRIFDLYEGANIDSNKKSMAITIDFSSPDKTLKDEEVNVVMEKVIGAIKIRFLAEVRQ